MDEYIKLSDIPCTEVESDTHIPVYQVQGSDKGADIVKVGMMENIHDINVCDIDDSTSVLSVLHTEDYVKNNKILTMIKLVDKKTNRTVSFDFVKNSDTPFIVSVHNNSCSKIVDKMDSYVGKVGMLEKLLEYRINLL